MRASTNVFTNAALAISISASSLVGQPNLNPPRPPEIAATGRAEIAVSPDRATVLVSVETRAPTAAAASSANAAKMTSVLQGLRNAGLAQTDIATMGFNVGQDPRSMRVAPNLPQPPIEFLARNMVRATVRRVEDVGKIIDAALAGGATSIASVQMTSQNTEEARRTALAQAVTQAQRDAEVLARAAGGSLGRLLSMSSSPSSFPYSESYGIERDMLASSYAPPIMSRDIMLSVTAFGRWEFVPGR